MLHTQDEACELLCPYRGSATYCTTNQGLRFAPPLAMIPRPIRGENHDRRKNGEGFIEETQRINVDWNVSYFFVRACPCVRYSDG